MSKQNQEVGDGNKGSVMQSAFAAGGKSNSLNIGLEFNKLMYTVWQLRCQILIVAIMCVAVFVPQTQELFLRNSNIFHSGIKTQKIVSIFVSSVLVLSVSYFIFKTGITIFLTLLFSESTKPEKIYKRHRLWSIIRDLRNRNRWDASDIENNRFFELTYFIPCLMFLTFAPISIHFCMNIAFSLQNDLLVCVACFFIYSISLFVKVFLLLRIPIFFSSYKVHDKNTRPALGIREFKYVVAFTLLIVFSFCLTLLPQYFSSVIAIPNLLGSLVFFYLSLLVFLLIGHVIIKLEISLNYPLFAILLVFLFLLNYFFRFNENHEIRTTKTENKIRLIEPNQAFLKWIQDPARLGTKEAPSEWRQSGKKFPVLFVCLEGGGIYAAAHGSLVLEKLSQIPDFNRHVFVLSGISGGSLAAALHLASLENKLIDPHFDSVGKLNEFFLRDFLAPLFNAMFFADLFQLFIPVSIESFDRARQLEYSLESTDWIASTINKSIFSYNTTNNGLPYLALTSTLTHSGERIVASPLGFETSRFNTPLSVQNNFRNNKKPTIVPEPAIKNITNLIDSRSDIRIGTSVFVSARFPIVTPPASIRVDPEVYGDRIGKLKLVDGGYFENSGASVLFDIINYILYANNPEKFGDEKGERDIRPEILANPIKIGVIRIGSTPDFDPGNIKPGDELSGIYYGLVNPRTERQYESLLHTRYLIASYNKLTNSKAAADKSNFFRFRIRTKKYNLPLGWVLSEESYSKIFHSVFESGLNIAEDQVSGRDPALVEQLKKDLQETNDTIKTITNFIRK